MNLSDLFDFEFSILETIVRGSVFYLALVVILRLIPKRETGSISDIAMVKQAVLEADGHISVVPKDGV